MGTTKVGQTVRNREIDNIGVIVGRKEMIIGYVILDVLLKPNFGNIVEWNEEDCDIVNDYCVTLEEARLL